MFLFLICGGIRSMASSKSISKTRQKKPILSGEIASSQQEELSGNSSISKNFCMTPDYSLIKMTNELIAEVNGTGGTIEQTYHYVVDKGAMSWIKKSSQEDWLASRSSIPMEEIVDSIVHRLKKTSYRQDAVDILALGCGQANDERRMVQIFQKNTQIKDIKLNLFDISPFLLNEGYQKTRLAFSGDPQVEVGGVYGNFHYLQRHMEVLSISPTSNRLLVVMMLGSTWGNLENELLLLRSGFRALPPQTIFLVDTVERYAPVGDTGLVRAKDPWLKGMSPWQKESLDFLLTPLLIYREGMSNSSIEWEYVLDDHNFYIPGSYTVDVRVHLKPNVRFSLRKFKRYQQEGLQEVFHREDWTLFRSFPFNPNCRAYLFQKR